MQDAFRETILRIEKLMWSSIMLALILLFIDPSTESIDVLGARLHVSRGFAIVPLVLISLAIARRTLIRNAARIVSRLEEDGRLSHLYQFVEYYPVPEFMYLRFSGCSAVPEILALSLFLYLYEVVPPIALAISWYLVRGSQLIYSDAPGIAALILVVLAISNTELYMRAVIKRVREASNEDSS